MALAGWWRVDFFFSCYFHFRVNENGLSARKRLAVITRVISSPLRWHLYRFGDIFTESRKLALPFDFISQVSSTPAWCSPVVP